MTLAPLMAAPLPIIVHAFGAIAALVLGLVQIFGPKGTTNHRLLGWIWVILMTAVALSSFLIHEIRLIGPWSPIHLLSILTLVSLPMAVHSARRHQVTAHAKTMKSLFFFALIVAGAFTLLPGRIMGAVVFGFPLHP